MIIPFADVHWLNEMVTAFLTNDFTSLFFISLFDVFLELREMHKEKKSAELVTEFEINVNVYIVKRKLMSLHVEMLYRSNEDSVIFSRKYDYYDDLSMFLRAHT